MGKHLKLFNEDTEYQQFKETEDYILPNVSFIQESNSLAYNPYVKESIVVCITYNVTNTTSATQVCYNTSGFTSMEVDGVLLDSVVSGYTFNTVGEHTIKFELADPTTIGGAAFRDCSNLISIVIPDSVTSIGESAFLDCFGLRSIVIPDSVTSIGEGAFARCIDLTSVHIGSGVTSIGGYAVNSCNYLTEITCLAPTAPTIISDTFRYVKQGGVLKVPEGSDYSTWMSTSSYYLGYYNWTIEYI